MAGTLGSPRHEALRAFLVECRNKAGLRQVDLAKRLHRTQSYVAFVELMEWAEAIGFDPQEAIKRLAKYPRK
jgi:predicted transcriptional regulator